MATQTSLQVTFIGLGNMGAALVQAWLRSGNKAIIWNRTKGRQAISDLVSAGAQFEPSLKDAIAMSSITVICLLDYGNIHQIFDPLFGEKNGISSMKSVINLTNGTPEDARKMDSWMHAQGVNTYIDGGIMAAPYTIGTKESFIWCCGEKEETFEQMKPVVEVFGQAQYFGNDAGAANTYNMAVLSAMYGMFAGGLTALSMLAKAQQSSDQGEKSLEPTATKMLAPLLHAFVPSIAHIASTVDKGDYGANGHSMAMQSVGIKNVIRACEELGVDASLLQPMQKATGDIVRNDGGEGGISLIVKQLLK